MKFFSIVWRCFLGGFLLFQLVFFTSGQVQSAKMYVPICIDQVFDLRTGEFGEKDSSLCGSGTRMGEGRYGDDGPGSGWRDYRPAGITFDRDFQFEEDTGDGSNEGPNVQVNVGQRSVSVMVGNKDVSPVDRLSPMDQSLNEWQAENERRNKWLRSQTNRVPIDVQINYLNKKNNSRFLSFVTDQLFEEFEEEFFSKNVFNIEVRSQMEDWARNTYPKVQKYLQEQDKSVKELDALWINFTVRAQMAKRIFRFGVEILTKEKMRELGSLFVHSGPPTHWIQEVENIIKTGEKRLVEEPLYSIVTINQENFYWQDKDFANAVKEMEGILYYTAYRLAEIHIFEPHQNALDTNLSTLNETVSDSVKFTQHTSFSEVLSNSDPLALYKRDVTNRVQSHIYSLYNRKDLSVLKEKGLSNPIEELYNFKSPEGSFLEKNQALYEKLREANPYHEQGIRAREIGLSAVEVADEEFAKGHESNAELAYSIGEGMADIALGVLPFVGVAKDVYEVITGRHLLTGRALTGVERSFAFVGVGLSALSGGVFNAGALRLSLNRADKVLSKINQKLMQRFFKGLSALEAEKLFKSYPRMIFRTISNLGFRTVGEVRSAFQFMRRAFTKSSLTTKEAGSRTLKFVSREGVEDYKGALEELAKLGIRLPSSGEEFLAKQVRFSEEILGVGQRFTRSDLLRIGRVYSAYYKAMDEVEPAVFKGLVWRGVRKSGRGRGGVVFTNNPDDVFAVPSGSLNSSRRYSIPEEPAVYTSLSRKTSVQEIKFRPKQSTKPLTDQQVEELFHFGSKEIEVDKVLDLKDTNILKQLSKDQQELLTIDDIAEIARPRVNVYEETHILGHIAKRKGFQAIKAPSAPDKGGQNLIFFEELK